MIDGFLLLASLILVALAFDSLNRLHDAANSIATIVSTRVLRPQYAVFWAVFFNFVAFLLFGLHVAQTVGTGVVAPDIVDDRVIFGALMGTIVGVGAAQRVSAVRWNVARDIVVAWLITLPLSATIAALFYALARLAA